MTWDPGRVSSTSYFATIVSRYGDEVEGENPNEPAKLASKRVAPTWVVLMVQCARDLVKLTFLSVAVHEGAFEFLPADNVIIPVGASAADTPTDTTVRPTTFARFAGVARQSSSCQWGRSRCTPWRSRPPRSCSHSGTTRRPGG